MSKLTSSADQKPNPAEMTVFQQMSRQPNYRTMRASERIFEAWNKLPLFAEVLGDGDKRGIQSVGFIRRVFKEAKPAPPFNSSMARAKQFRPQTESCPDDPNSIECILKAAADSTDFEVYLSAVENANPSHPCVRRAAGYFRNLLKAENFDLERLDDLERQKIHHHGLELYRRLPYTEVLNKFIYPVLCPSEKPERGPKALLFDAAWNWSRTAGDAERRCKEEPLPGFMALKGAPTLPAEKQNNFEPSLPGEDDTRINATRKWHETWFRSIEATEGLKDAGDFLILAVPIREGWQNDTPYGSYLGHLALFLRRDRFFGPDDLDEKKNPRRMSELPESQQRIWAQMVRFHEGLIAFLNREERSTQDDDDPDKWFADYFSKPEIGRLHWEAMRRDLDDFVDAHYESEFDEWLNIEFPPSASHADVLNILKSVAIHTDGWTPVDCPNVDTLLKIPPSKYDDYFQYVEESRTIFLHLKSETPNPGASPKNTLDLCLRADPDTIIPPLVDAPNDPNKLRDPYFRRVWKRYNNLYQRLLRRAEFAAAGQRSGILASAHDYSKDIGPILSQLAEYGEKIRASMGTIQTEADRLTGLPAPAEEVRNQIKEELQELQAKPAPRFGWFAATRFLNAHLVTQTRGVLLPEPVECVKMLEAGRLADLEEIMRLLVWHPVTIQELKDRERKYTKWSPEKLRMSSTWWTLFSFDLDPLPASRPFREKLGQRVCSLILDEKMDQTAFAERFQVPQIKIVNNSGDPVPSLWPDEDAERWRPLDGLLPLLVFSMRFAFQSVWAKTILEEPKQPLAIRITPSKPAHRKNQFRISFPSLISPGSPMEEHPYFREWEGQIGHYRGKLVWKSSPWKAVAATTPVTHESWGDICQITLTAAT